MNSAGILPCRIHPSDLESSSSSSESEPDTPSFSPISSDGETDASDSEFGSSSPEEEATEEEMTEEEEIEQEDMEEEGISHDNGIMRI